MNKSLSAYIDFLRFLAALVVIFNHSAFFFSHGQYFTNFNRGGHDAVIIFFVLSGFVISYAGSKTSNCQDFIINRLSRLYSVVIPAIIVTLLCDYIGKQINPDIYTAKIYRGDDPVEKVVSALLFINEIWFAKVWIFTNGPFWSLGYEFWYYILFAIAIYFKGQKRIVGLMCVSVLIGPKILILIIPWLMGSCLFFCIEKIKKIDIRVALVMIVGSIILYFMAKYFWIDRILLKLNKAWMSKALFSNLSWSKNFLWDYIVGVLFSVHLAGAIALCQKSTIRNSLSAVTGYLGSISFSMYLYHFPLLTLFSTFMTNGLVIMIALLVTIAILAVFTEWRRDSYKAVIQKLIHIARV